MKNTERIAFMIVIVVLVGALHSVTQQHVSVDAKIERQSLFEPMSSFDVSLIKGDCHYSVADGSVISISGDYPDQMGYDSSPVFLERTVKSLIHGLILAARPDLHCATALIRETSTGREFVQLFFIDYRIEGYVTTMILDK